jgi:hypothetical protein
MLTTIKPSDDKTIPQSKPSVPDGKSNLPTELPDFPPPDTTDPVKS